MQASQAEGMAQVKARRQEGSMQWGRQTAGRMSGQMSRWGWSNSTWSEGLGVWLWCRELQAASEALYSREWAAFQWMPGCPCKGPFPGCSLTLCTYSRRKLSAPRKITGTLEAEPP